MCGIRYSRVVGSSGHFALPENPYRWQATCHHNQRLLELGEEFIERQLGMVWHPARTQSKAAKALVDLMK